MTPDLPGPPSAIVKKLTGPAGPEIGCDECFEALDVYVELELVGSDADKAVPGMRAHLTGCPACRDDHDSLLVFLLADPADPR